MAIKRATDYNEGYDKEYVGPTWEYRTLWEVTSWRPRYPYSPNINDRVFKYSDPLNERAYRGLPHSQGFTPGDVSSSRVPRIIKTQSK